MSGGLSLHFCQGSSSSSLSAPPISSSSSSYAYFSLNGQTSVISKFICQKLPLTKWLDVHSCLCLELKQHYSVMFVMLCHVSWLLVTVQSLLTDSLNLTQNCIIECMCQGWISKKRLCYLYVSSESDMRYSHYYAYSYIVYLDIYFIWNKNN